MNKIDRQHKTRNIFKKRYLAAFRFVCIAVCYTKGHPTWENIVDNLTMLV